MTPADQIRAAVTHLRAVAGHEDIPAGPWMVEEISPFTDPVLLADQGAEVVTVGTLDVDPAVADHIALMDPGVALLIADWLDDAEQSWRQMQEQNGREGIRTRRGPAPWEERALALSRAIGARRS